MVIDTGDTRRNGTDGNGQQGSALVVCLMILGILTLLGTTALLTTTTETKITYNSRKSEQAFFAADAGIEFVKKMSLEEVQDLTAGMTIPSTSALGCVVKVVAVNDAGSDTYRVCFESEGNDPHNSSRRIIRADVQIAPVPGGWLISQGEIEEIY